MVHGDAEEFARRVADLPSVHLAHHLQAALTLLIAHSGFPSGTWSDDLQA
jgi:hypothetical protein